MVRGIVPLSPIWLLSVLLWSAPTRAEPEDPARVEQGRQLIDQHGCLACHSLDGSTAPGPTLQGIVDRSSPEQIKQSITDPSAVSAEGYEGRRMPAYALTESELDAIVAALGEPPPPKEPSKLPPPWAIGLAVLYLIGSHFVLCSPRVRSRLVTAMTEPGFKAFYVGFFVVAVVILIFAWWP